MTPCICHEGARDSSGYGIVRRKGKMLRRHRLAWIAAHGPIPDGIYVLHRCDNRRCFNVEHLFLGTLGDNNRDRAQKKRSAVGERHARAKLSAADIPTIRALLASDTNMHEIGRRYGIDWTTVRAIRDGQTWQSIPSLAQERS